MHDFIRTVQVDEDFFIYEGRILVPADVVNEGLFGAAMVAPQDQELGTVLRLRLLPPSHFKDRALHGCKALLVLHRSEVSLSLGERIEEAPVDCVLPAELVLSADSDPFALLSCAMQV